MSYEVYESMGGSLKPTKEVERNVILFEIPCPKCGGTVRLYMQNQSGTTGRLPKNCPHCLQTVGYSEWPWRASRTLGGDA